jgi:uncharacterized membrane protein
MDDEKISKYTHDEKHLFKKFLTLFIIGFFLIFLGIIILAVASLLSGGSVDVGGVIFIWFIPIVFGAGPNAFWMVVLAIILAFLSIIIFFTLRRGMGKTNLYISQLFLSSLP